MNLLCPWTWILTFLSAWQRQHPGEDENFSGGLHGHHRMHSSTDTFLLNGSWTDVLAKQLRDVLEESNQITNMLSRGLLRAITVTSMHGPVVSDLASLTAAPTATHLLQLGHLPGIDCYSSETARVTRPRPKGRNTAAVYLLFPCTSTVVAANAMCQPPRRSGHAARANCMLPTASACDAEAHELQRMLRLRQRLALEKTKSPELPLLPETPKTCVPHKPWKHHPAPQDFATEASLVAGLPSPVPCKPRTSAGCPVSQEPFFATALKKQRQPKLRTSQLSVAHCPPSDFIKTSRQGSSGAYGARSLNLTRCFRTWRRRAWAASLPTKRMHRRRRPRRSRVIGPYFSLLTHVLARLQHAAHYLRVWIYRVTVIAAGPGPKSGGLLHLPLATF